MSDTFRACVAFNNLVDRPSTLIRASSSAPFLPVQLLRDPHIGRRWRGLSGVETLVLDFGGPVPIDTVALVGCNMTLAGSMRLRGSNTASQADEDTLFDETFAGGCNPRYGYQIGLLPEPVSVRYLRIDLSQPGSVSIEAGRLFVGIRHQYEVNFAYGWQMTWVDPSPKIKSAGGSTFIDRKRRFRVLDLVFEHVPEYQRWSFVEDLDATVGASTDILMLSHPEEADLGQRTVWGLNVEVTPTAESYFKRFVKSYRIEERL